jgi:hypothetical protein
MKGFFFFVLICTCCHVSLAHNQRTHQYITIEAYNLLKMNLGQDVPVMVDKVHTTFPANEGGPWQLGYITRGAYREDEEDPICNYWTGNPPSLYGDANLTVTLSSVTILSIIQSFLDVNIDPFVSVTHFWNADYSNTTLGK